MQRRAAAAYFALFVLLAAGAYTFMQVGMTQPAASFDADAYSQGDELTAGGVSYEVTGVEAQEEEGETTYSGELTFTNQTSGEEETVSLEQGGNVTLGDGQYFAYFPSGEEVYVLQSDQYYDAYQDELDTQANFQERTAGFWGIVYISLLGAIVLLMSAYLPVKG